MKLKHLGEWNHFGLQLLTGHGAFADYLEKHGKLDNKRCPICEEDDSPSHPILECPGMEMETDALDDTVVKARLEKPWNLSTLLRDGRTYTELMYIWKTVYAKRKL